MVDDARSLDSARDHDYGTDPAGEKAWELDRLAALIERAARFRKDSRLYADPRYLEWLARDAAEMALPEDRWSDEQIHELAERVEHTLWVSRLPLRTVRTSPDDPYPAVPRRELTVREHDGPGGLADLPEHSIAAGAGLEVWDSEAEEGVRVPADVPRGRYVALRVRGDSMEPLMHEGDIVLVRRDEDVKPDTIVVARRGDDGYVVKGVGRVTPTELELRSANAAYPPVTVRREAHSVLGTVVLRWCAHGTSSR